MSTPYPQRSFAGGHWKKTMKYVFFFSKEHTTELLE